MTDTRAADAALETCLKVASTAAEPWTILGDNVEYLRKLFAEDFRREIGSQRRWSAWSDKARRLGRYVGTFAAFYAEVAAGPMAEPSSIDRAHLDAAVDQVMLMCPPTASLDARPMGRLCAAASRAREEAPGTEPASPEPGSTNGALDSAAPRQP